ncbi:MAG: HDOD domain-containing protein [Syntrophobacteraceae bacterium]
MNDSGRQAMTGSSLNLARKHRALLKDSAEVDSRALSAITARIDSFPALPITVNQVIRLTANPRSTTEDLEKVIITDQSLTATILKLANSAFFGYSRKVGSLDQALKILGFSEIRNLVLAKAVFSSFRKLNGTAQFDIARFWEHSFLCGLAARLLGKAFKKGGDDLFVAGLIHDIGKLLIYVALPAEFTRIMEAAGTLNSSTHAVERNIVGCAHDEVGMSLLDRWLFPENLIEAVHFHHRPEQATSFPVFAAVVHLADILAYHGAVPEGSDEFISLKEELFHPRVIELCRSNGLEWNSTIYDNVLSKLMKLNKEKTATLNVLLS